MLDILEHIHENEYAHSDTKALNLLPGYRNPDRVILQIMAFPTGIVPLRTTNSIWRILIKAIMGLKSINLDAHKGTGEIA